jgi:hypothetical protein
MTRAWLVLLAACSSPATQPAIKDIPVHPEPDARCIIALENPGGTLAIGGVGLPDFRVATLRAVLGEPDRIERTEYTGYEEESGETDSDPWTSHKYQAVDHHYVYDRRGLVFSTDNGSTEHVEPAVLRIFFASPRVFDNQKAPPVLPKQRGTCEVTINGIVVDPARDLRPPGATYRTERFPLFGTTFGPTSYAMAIDRLYTLDGARSIHVFLDGPRTGRASYAEIR